MIIKPDVNQSANICIVVAAVTLRITLSLHLSLPCIGQ